MFHVNCLVWFGLVGFFFFILLWFLDVLELEISLYSTLFCSSSMCNRDLSGGVKLVLFFIIFLSFILFCI